MRHHHRFFSPFEFIHARTCSTSIYRFQTNEVFEKGKKNIKKGSHWNFLFLLQFTAFVGHLYCRSEQIINDVTKFSFNRKLRSLNDCQHFCFFALSHNVVDPKISKYGYTRTIPTVVIKSYSAYAHNCNVINRPHLRSLLFVALTILDGRSSLFLFFCFVMRSQNTEKNH